MKAIYHERQESALCGQHCLNNLLQGPYFSAVELSEIALELDRKERQLAGPMEYRSQNVDDSGNFSIQVLRCAMERHSHIGLEPWFKGGSERDPLNEKGFIVNRSDHWYTIRKLHGQWWNLNSSIDFPEPVGPFYLSALLTSLKLDGYSVFNATGPVPDKGDPSSMDYLNKVSTGTWYNEDDIKAILGGRGPRTVSNGDGDNDQPPKKTFNAFEGKGNRLGGDNSVDASLLAGAENDEELQMALAISASLQQQKEDSSKVSSKEDLRAKRLAALSKLG